jgi:hypothetical protein
MSVLIRTGMEPLRRALLARYEGVEAFDEEEDFFGAELIVCVH